MAPATSEKIFKVFPIISLWELYVTHGLYIKFDQNWYNTPLKMGADNDNRPSIYSLSDNDNRPSIYSLSYLTWAFNSGELKQCDQKLGFR